MALKNWPPEQLEHLITLLDKDRTVERLKLMPWEHGLHLAIYSFFCLVPITAALFAVGQGEAYKILVTGFLRPIIGVTLVVAVLDLRRLILVLKLGMGKIYLTIGQSWSMLGLMTFVLIVGLLISFVLLLPASMLGPEFLIDSLLTLPTLFVIYLVWWNRKRLDRLAETDLLKDELFHRQSTRRT